MHEDRELLRAALRQDLPSFVHRTFQTVTPGHIFKPNWHIDAIAWHLQQCYAGNIRRLIITVPPRNLKSICASVAFPAWVLGQDPTSRLICISYSESLSRKLAIDCRTIVDASWYRWAFPGTRLHRDKRSALEFMTTRRGHRLATSVSGTITGRGGGFLIIDDPIKPEEAFSQVTRERVNQWYDGTAYTRQDDKATDCIIIVMQRLHTDDLAGHVLEHEHENWVHLDLPAIAESHHRIQVGPDHFITRYPGHILHPEREPKWLLDDIREMQGPYYFSAQYQQSPVPPGGNMVQRKWFNTYEVLPKKASNNRVIQSWDTASKTGVQNDYSVCMTWLEVGERYYLMHVFRERLEYPALKRRVVRLRDELGADVVLIEDSSAGTHLLQDLRQEGTMYPISIRPEGDKIMRMSAQTAKIEAGRVYLPVRAPWLVEFEAEILAFPSSKHDDQVDSLSQFLGWVSRPRANPQIRQL